MVNGSNTNQKQMSCAMKFSIISIINSTGLCKQKQAKQNKQSIDNPFKI